jgi:hypothetical protein
MSRNVIFVLCFDLCVLCVLCMLCVLWRCHFLSLLDIVAVPVV